ncbi:lysine--tRNA ligase [Candidatus Woesearchaeota archaeon]|nr:lysine--tRNA ligase [Candidatus Woesearchaeota archaeon]
MSKEEEIFNQRLKKIEEIKSLEINPYPYKFDQKNHSKEILEKYKNLDKEEKTKDNVSLAGRIMSLREMGKASFGHIQDVSGKIQFYIREDQVGEKIYTLFKKLDLGDIIGITGTVFRTKTGEISILIKELELLVKSLRPLPEKFHGLKDTEIRYRKRYVDLIVNPEVKETFVKRAKIYKAIREFLDQRGFIEVRTPILQTQYGGANARPFITKINAWNMKMYLRIAYELDLKRLIVGGFEKIYDLSSCFRNEDADRTHNPEFAMMEIQWAYADYHDAMKLTEELWEYTAKEILGTTIIEYGGNKINLKAPWKRLTVKDALKELTNVDVDKLKDLDLLKLIDQHKIEYENKPSRGEIIMLLFEKLCEHKLIQPTHIIDHPKESCPLARIHRKDQNLIERIEPFINGFEVGNCYTELNDPILQRKLLEEQAKKGRGGDEEAHPMDEDFVQSMEFGLPPNTGIGVGVDRMIMLLTGAESIRDVILFPTMKPENLVEEKQVK